MITAHQLYNYIADHANTYHMKPLRMARPAMGSDRRRERRAQSRTNMHWSLFGTGESICCKFLELLEIGGNLPVPWDTAPRCQQS